MDGIHLKQPLPELPESPTASFCTNDHSGEQLPSSVCAEGGALSPGMPAEFQNVPSPSWERKGAGAAQVRSQTLTKRQHHHKCQKAWAASLQSSYLPFQAPAFFQPQKHTSSQKAPTAATSVWKQQGASPASTSRCSHARPSWQVGEHRKNEPTDMCKSPAANVLVCGGIVHTRKIIQVCKTKIGHRFYNHLC